MGRKKLQVLKQDEKVKGEEEQKQFEVHKIRWDKEEGSDAGEDNDKKNETNGKRQDNSLSVLTNKFISLIKSSVNKTVDLNEAV